MQQQTMTIALAADIKYSEQIITLIKSICYHNRNPIKFYLLHKEYPNEWFDSLNHYLNKIDCEIISAAILNENLHSFRTAEHISEVTYYRYFIPNLPEERILYLDSDIVVNGNLHDFYHQTFQGKSAIVIPDMFLNYEEHFEQIRPYFNAGVLLINNHKWKENHIFQKLLTFTEQFSHELIYGDQDALNIILHNDIITADKIYNFQTSARFGYDPKDAFKKAEKIEKLDQEPIIIHYTNIYKPWFSCQETLFRDKYWFYYRLEWQDIIQHYLER